MISSLLALTLLDVVAVSTIARCFNGPSELVLLVPMCIGAHLIARAARLAAERGKGGLGGVIWAACILLVLYVPLAALDGGSLHWMLPLGATRHLVSGQLASAWKIFSTKVSPVATQRGLVLVAAWAAGAVGIASEALDADTALPKIVALVPAFDVVVFSGTLGTSTGRAIELAALSALAVWYLALAARQPSGEQVVTARLEGSMSPAAVARGVARARPGGARRHRRVSLAAPGLLALAALAAGLIGPLLPGATSVALVAWHGARGAHGPHRTGGQGPNTGASNVSTLVEVGEQEVENSNTVLFDVFSPIAGTRETLIALDRFNGNQWTSSSSGASSGSGGRVITLPSFRASLAALRAHPLPVQQLGSHSTITQVVDIQNLGGDYLPTPGTTEAVATVSAVRGILPGSPLVDTVPINGQTSYGVRAVLDPPPPTTPPSGAPGARPSIPPSMAQYLSLPGGLPARIAALAHSIVSSVSGETDEAEALQSYFLLPGSGFRYVLPKRTPSGAIADQGEGYAALDAFLFQDKSGYCQQYASAFAVLARADGLPARVVVGFLAGPQLGTNGWEVTGQQVHAWPQVWFPGTGWVDFEPTPGAPGPVTVSSTQTTVPPVTQPGGRGGNVPTTLDLRLHGLVGGPTPAPTIASVAHGHHGAGSGSGPLDVVLALLAAALAWLVGAPSLRLLADRKAQRDPVRGVLSSWRSTQRVLAVAGLHRRRSETFGEFAQRVRLSGVLNAESDDALRRLAQTANKAAFSRRPPTDGEAVAAHADGLAVQRVARKRMPRWQRLAMSVDPRPAARVL